MDSMRDPLTANCRIYIGNLELNTSRSELQNIFGKYGTIKGVLVSRNFGFVQYDNEHSVCDAIDNEHQKMYNGRRIIVSKVQKKGNQKPNDKPSMSNSGAEPLNSQNTINDPIQVQSNNDTNINVPATNINTPQNLNKIQPNSNNNNSGNNLQQNIVKNNVQQSNVNHPSRPQWRNNRNNNNRNNNNNEMNLQTDRERSPLDGGWNTTKDGGNNSNNNNNIFRNNRAPNNKNNANNANFNRNETNTNISTQNNNENAPKNVLTGGVLRGFASAREIRARYPNANDCEIVVVEKQLTEYAEYIEGRLQRLGLSADLLFPNTDLTFGKMLSNIANRGSLYAILISSENKEMRSVTLNILYGIPAEHRNMPIEDALELIYRNYEELRQGSNGDIYGDNDESPYASVALATVRHSDSIQHLINLLADNRCLTVLQFDCLLKYLQERRELQYKFELGDTEPDVKMQDVKPTSSTGIRGDEKIKVESADNQKDEQTAEEELQKRLLEILNKPTISNIKSESFSSITVSDSSPPTQSELQEPTLLNDPKVKNALDSLFSF